MVDQHREADKCDSLLLWFLVVTELDILVDRSADISLVVGMKFKSLLVLPLIVASLQAASVDDLTFTLINGNTEYSVSDCLTSASGSLEIPSVYNGLPVTSIGNSAFRDCTALASITIGNNVASIGSFAFSRCYYIDNITIPYSVTSIGIFAFSDCSNLTSITIPDSVNSIRFNAFNNCTSLRSISFSNPLLEAAEAERDARLTMDEVRDARIGSTMIEVSEGKADITMTIEETSDLSDWSSATTSEKTIEVDAPAGTRFFRFKMSE